MGVRAPPEGGAQLDLSVYIQPGFHSRGKQLGPAEFGNPHTANPSTSFEQSFKQSLKTDKPEPRGPNLIQDSEKMLERKNNSDDPTGMSGEPRETRKIPGEMGEDKTLGFDIS